MHKLAYFPTLNRSVLLIWTVRIKADSTNIFSVICMSSPFRGLVSPYSIKSNLATALAASIYTEGPFGL